MDKNAFSKCTIQHSFDVGVDATDSGALGFRQIA